MENIPKEIRNLCKRNNMLFINVIFILNTSQFLAHIHKHIKTSLHFFFIKKHICYKIQVSSIYCFLSLNVKKRKEAIKDLKKKGSN